MSSPPIAVASAVASILEEHGPPVVVALDGYSATGKSSLGEAIAARLDAALVHCDDFYRDIPEAVRVGLSPTEGVDRYFDWERLRDEALRPLSMGRPATFRCFDWTTGHGHTGPMTVAVRPVVVVEGVYSARPEFDGFLHLRILVEASVSLREERRRARRDPHEWEDRWDAAERLYFSSVRQPASFDLVVSGSG